jgi:hypothetical protein
MTAGIIIIIIIIIITFTIMMMNRIHSFYYNENTMMLSSLVGWLVLLFSADVRFHAEYNQPKGLGRLELLVLQKEIAVQAGLQTNIQLFDWIVLLLLAADRSSARQPTQS